MGKISLEVLRRVENKFFDTVELKENGCIIWKGGYINPDGYGEFQFRFCGDKKKVIAHRAAYMLYHGVELTSDVIIRHTCDNPQCIAEIHLIKGTHQDNVADRVSRGRSATGERNGRYVHGRHVQA